MRRPIWPELPVLPLTRAPSLSELPPPVVVGGTGGSGTRVVERILRQAGFYMGRVNGTGDALAMARVDRRHGPRFLRTGDERRMARAFDRALRRYTIRARRAGGPWGWKHPHSYLFLPFLAERLPGMRFVHVVRDGRDMALSDNLNQLRLYGECALGRPPGESQLDAAAYWAWANTRAHEYGTELLGERYLLLRLEELCAEPDAGARGLLSFAGASRGFDGAAREVSPPASLGRWRTADARAIDELQATIAPALRALGYR